MKRVFWITIITTGLALGFTALGQGDVAPAAPAPAAVSDYTSIPAGDIERGRYIVEHLSLCVQCHTPRDENGDMDTSRWLEGAPVPVGAPYWTEDWALRAPSIYGFVGYDREQALEFLITGIARDGEPARSPMPPFRMNTEDAAAVVDFLMSSRR